MSQIGQTRAINIGSAKSSSVYLDLSNILYPILLGSGSPTATFYSNRVPTKTCHARAALAITDGVLKVFSP